MVGGFYFIMITDKEKSGQPDEARHTLPGKKVRTRRSPPSLLTEL